MQDWSLDQFADLFAAKGWALDQHFSAMALEDPVSRNYSYHMGHHLEVCSSEGPLAPRDLRAVWQLCRASSCMYNCFRFACFDRVCIFASSSYSSASVRCAAYAQLQSRLGKREYCFKSLGFVHKCPYQAFS